jgi:hypothetical protein
MKILPNSGRPCETATRGWVNHAFALVRAALPRRRAKSPRLRKSLVGAGASAILGLVFTVAQPVGAPLALAGPDAQCQDPAYTTAIVFPNSGQWEHTAVVACVPVSVVGHDCRAPLGEPHTLLYPRGQGPEPACHSIYGTH